MCLGMCADGTMSPDCSYGITVGSPPDVGPVALGTMANLQTSKSYPLHYKEAAVDVDASTSWWTYDFIVDRSIDTGGWYSFEVPAPRDPQCIRVSMADCAKVPEVMVVHKGVGGVTKESTAYFSDNTTFPRPGWTESRVHGVSSSTVDLDISCGIANAQYFGEKLVDYLRVPSPCLCKQLCLDHVDEGCETWKWYEETGQCFLQTDIFIGDSTTADSPKSYKAGVRTEGLYLTSTGWWRRAFAPDWHGWTTGDTGPLVLRLRVNAMPADAKGLDRQRIKILSEDAQCAHGIPPPEVSGIRCTNAFTCSPKPSRGSRREATWDNITIAESKVLVPYKVCWCGGECWDSANWAETPGRLHTNDAAYVWHSSVPPPLTRKDVPVIKVTRRPFATTTAVTSWRLKLVRSVFGCELLGDPELCGGYAAPDCGTATSVGPDEGTWQVPIAVGVVPGDYKVCLDDGGGHWVQISSSEKLYLEVDRLPQDSTHPAGLFHEQRVSAFRSETVGALSKIELK